MFELKLTRFLKIMFILVTSRSKNFKICGSNWIIQRTYACLYEAGDHYLVYFTFIYIYPTKKKEKKKKKKETHTVQFAKL